MFDRFPAHHINRYKLLGNSVSVVPYSGSSQEISKIIHLKSVANPDSEALSCGSSNRTTVCLPSLWRRASECTFLGPLYEMRNDGILYQIIHTIKYFYFHSCICITRHYKTDRNIHHWSQLNCATLKNIIFKTKLQTSLIWTC